MFKYDLQYRCTIIRGKAQTELDNLLPTYANIIADICPIKTTDFKNYFNERFSKIQYDKEYIKLEEAQQKTIWNHRTEIAGKLFGLYYHVGDLTYESDSNKKLLDDNDQPAFFKNICLNFQFPNGMQKKSTVLERIENNIRFKPFHYILSLLMQATKREVSITKDEISYYVLNAKQVLQGKVDPSEVLNVILENRSKNIFNKLVSGSKHNQHIREQLNLLILANLITIENNNLILNLRERKIIEEFIKELEIPLKFDIYGYDLSSISDERKMYSDWGEYFGKIALKDCSLLSTSLEALKKISKEESIPPKGINMNILGDAGEEHVFNLEKNRVKNSYPRLANKVLLLGSQRGLGYDISSIEANENIEEPEFARFIEVKSTKRVTEPDLSDNTWIDTINLTRKEWIAAKQYGEAYNIYRVYFTPISTIVRKINDPFNKNETGAITVLPTMYRMDFGSQSIDKEY